jgi:hypothetical protein
MTCLIAQLPNWIQALSAAALVVLTFLSLLVLRGYARDTKTIADKSVEQSQNAQKQVAESQRQADAAMESLRLLKAQTEARDAQELVRAIAVLRSIRSNVIIWLNVIDKQTWPVPPLTVKLMPDDWSAIVYQSGKVSATLRNDVELLEGFLADANAKISQFLARGIEQRSEQLLRLAQVSLVSADHYLAKIIDALGKHNAKAPQSDVD